MAKTKRGKVLKKIPGWRGTCPICHRARVKVVWTKIQDGETLNVCKRCSNS